MAKEHAVKEVEYFTKYNFPNTPDKFIETMDKAVKTLAPNLNKKWITVINFENYFREIWNDEMFRLIWANKILEENGFMLWNCIYNPNDKNSEKNADNAFETLMRKYR